MIIRTDLATGIHHARHGSHGSHSAHGAIGEHPGRSREHRGTTETRHWWSGIELPRLSWRPTRTGAVTTLLATAALATTLVIG